MSKLKNIQALQQMLQGTHRTQTRKTFGFSDAKSTEEKNRTRQIGEIWKETDFNGNELWWEQLDGYRVKYHTHPDVAREIQKIRDYLSSFPNCPKEICTCNSPTRIDHKFRRLMGMCEDCVISFETSLKIKGQFDEYAISKMRMNADAFFKQADQEVEILKQEMQNIHFAGDSNGDPIETWKFQDTDSFLKYIDEQYLNFKEKTLEKFNFDQNNKIRGDVIVE